MPQNNRPVRKIIHVDMDAFFASVEQRDHPELKGKPVAVGGSSRRGVVAAASYEARQFGVFSAMSSVIAQQKCPHLIFVPPRFEVYKSVSREIHEVFRLYTNLIEPLSLDEAYLDVTTNKSKLSSATEIALEIKKGIKQKTGLTASAGVSVNKFLAKIASDMDKPDGLYVINPGQVQAFIDQLDIKKFFGVGKVTAARMHELGIYKGRDLKQWSREELVRQFGKSGSYYYDVARGRDHRPVKAERSRKSLGAEKTFENNLTQREDLLERIEVIAREVIKRMQSADVRARTVTVKIKFADFKQITRSLSVTDPVTEFTQLYALASQLLEETFESGMEIRLLGITLSNLVGQDERHIPQLDLDL